MNIEYMNIFFEGRAFSFRSVSARSRAPVPIAKWEIRSKNNYRDVARSQKKKNLFLLFSSENKKGLQIIPIPIRDCASTNGDRPPTR